MVDATLAVVVTIDEALEALVVTIDARSRYYINYGDNQHSPVVSAVLVQRVGAPPASAPGFGGVLAGRRTPTYRRRRRSDRSSRGFWSLLCWAVVRFSFGRFTTDAEIELAAALVLDALEECVFGPCQEDV